MTPYAQQRIAEIKAGNGIKRLAATAGHKHVHVETTRHGRKVWYYRENKDTPRVRLPDPSTVGDAAFNQAYEAARNGRPAPAAQRAAPLPPFSLTIGKPGFVYFLRAGDKIKIGFSANVPRRLKGIQTSCPEAAEIVKVIPGSNQTERYFHAHFAAHRIAGEWFRLDGQLAAFLS